jgi:hypothetical protein
MGQVIGPVDIASWRTMLMLKEDNRGMGLHNTDGKYNLAIKRNNETLDLFMDEIHGRIK